MCFPRHPRQEGKAGPRTYLAGIPVRLVGQMRHKYCQLVGTLRCGHPYKSLFYAKVYVGAARCPRPQVYWVLSIGTRRGAGTEDPKNKDC